MVETTVINIWGIYNLVPHRFVSETLTSELGLFIQLAIQCTSIKIVPGRTGFNAMKCLLNLEKKYIYIH